MHVAISHIMHVDIGRIAIDTDVSANFFNHDGPARGVDGDRATWRNRKVEIDASRVARWLLLKRMRNEFDSGTAMRLINLVLVGVKRSSGQYLRSCRRVHRHRTVVVRDRDRCSGPNTVLHILP